MKKCFAAVIITFIAGCLSQESMLEKYRNEVYTGPLSDEINAFTEYDNAHGVKSGVIVFTGSSNIKGWDLVKYFPELDVVNRGFGGSEISQAVNYFNRIVLIHLPSILVFYSGKNDIASGEPVDQVFNDLKEFHGLVRKHLPKTKMIYISAKPSPLRWNLWPKFQQFNRKAERYCGEHENLYFLDVSEAMLRDNKPKEEIFKPDKIHMNDKGYKIWHSLLLPMLEQT